jgi:hypothetical protein
VNPRRRRAASIDLLTAAEFGRSVFLDEIAGLVDGVHCADSLCGPRRMLPSAVGCAGGRRVLSDWNDHIG